MRRTAASEFFAVLILFTACTSVVPGSPSPPEPDVCYAPWEDEPYKSGRAIPAPGPDAKVPLCGA